MHTVFWMFCGVLWNEKRKFPMSIFRTRTEQRGAVLPTLGPTSYDLGPIWLVLVLCPTLDF